MPNTLYDSIEDLQRKLTRKPASENLGMLEPADLEGEIKNTSGARQLIDYGPDKRRSSKGLTLNAGDPNSVVGAVAPDYSGYDDILKGIKKPRDTSTADLITMGVSTGIGAMFGQTGVAAKIAGDYGMDRFNKAEKRENDLEDMITKLNLARATKMAAGKKGTRVSGGGNTWRDRSYVNPQDQKTYMMRFRDENGELVETIDDRVFQAPQTKLSAIPQEDGTVKTVPTQGNLRGNLDAGFKPEAKKVVEDAEGNKVLAGTTSGNLTAIGGNNFNTTSLGLSKSDDARYNTLSDKHTTFAKGLKTSRLQAEEGLTAIASKDNASALLALKEALRAAEGGKVSDADFTIMKTGLGPSFEQRINAWFGKVGDGIDLSNVERVELRNMLVHIKNSSQKGLDANANMFNETTGRFLTAYPKEVQQRLKFGTNNRGYNEATQRKESYQNINERKSYDSSNIEKRKVSDANGNVTVVEGFTDTKTGKFMVLRKVK